ncbi:MAG: T9SS type A sorting domain-containing protein [Bacteroidales bacterium]|nr:T9SS type A sorting domain-containing protein [Bacteroidales bacterium]
MKKIVLLIIIFATLGIYSFAQDHGSWVIPPYQIDFYSSGPVVSTISSSSSSFSVSAAAYKNNGELLFYVKDYVIYDENTNYIGSLAVENSAMQYEMEIINVPGQPDKYFIIYGWIAPYDGALRYAKVDCSTSTPILISDNLITTTFENAAFAIAEEKNASREMYIVKSSLPGLYKYSITASGVSFVSTIVDSSDPTLNDGDFFCGHNLELSQNELTLTWCTHRTTESNHVFIVNLTPQGGYLSSAKIQLNTPFVYGVEFADFPNNNTLYASCDGSNGGIYQIDYTTNQIIGQLNNSANFNNTFLQKAADGFIYAVSNNGNNLGRIDPSNNTFNPQAVTSLNIKSYLGADITIYKLPEDKKLYSQLGIELTSTYLICPGHNDGTATAIPIGGTPPYTYNWSPGGQTTQTITNLEEGTYQCCITDAIGDVICDEVRVEIDPNLFDYNEELVFNQHYPQTINNMQSSFLTGIRVKSGTKVTMENCDLQFGKFAKIIIEPGGELILDNSNLSNYSGCDDMWQGVQVWGNRNAHQWPDTQGNMAQGYLKLNDAVIENAVDAVALWNPGNNATTGGIVIAYNTVFRNNNKSVHALYYQNYNPYNGDEMSYRALFKNCDFVLDSDYIGSHTFAKHVDLSHVKGVNFIACDFNLSADAPNVSAWNMGIGAYSAGFSTKANCNSSTIPCSNWQNSTFNGFTYGIYTTGDETNLNTFNISRTHFNNNTYGIYNLEVDNFVVLYSEFHLGYNTKEQSLCEEESKDASGFGIYMTGANGFSIEENYFTKANGAPTGYYTGILCKESKTEYDIIYRNTFNGLSYGNFAEGDNRYQNDDQYGLEYQCNTNTGNNRDFIVTGEHQPQIRGYQGTINKEAGNSFSSVVQWPDGHFKNTGTQVINYFYNTNPPAYYTPFYVLPISIAGTNSCPSNYGGGGGTIEDVVLTAAEKQAAELAFANNLTDFNNVKSLFDNLTDGGNTQALKAEVETAWPSDMWELRAELLGNSPHLSKEVLVAAADKTDVLPESILFEILSANPDELRKEELISHLENKEQPLPAYMISILRQLAGGITYKTILLQDMASYQAGKTQAAYKLLRSCLNDTLTDYTYLRTWLNNLDNLNADKQIVSSYLAEANYAAAQAMLNLIPATRALEGDALTEYNDYKSMMQMQLAWQQQDRTIFELDSLEVDVLLDFTDNASGEAALLAKGILEYAYDYHYCNCLPVDDADALKSSVAIPGNELDNGLIIKASPNPASSWVTFDFTLPVQINEAVLQISDVQGRNITAFVITAKQGQQLWDIRDVKKGVYLYTLKAGAMSKNGKLIIQ